MQVLFALHFSYLSDPDYKFKESIEKLINSKELDKNKILSDYAKFNFIRTKHDKDYEDNEFINNFKKENSDKKNNCATKLDIKNSIIRDTDGNKYLDINSLTDFVILEWYNLFEKEQFSEMLPFLEEIQNRFPLILELCESRIIWIYYTQNQIDKKYDIAKQHLEKLKNIYEIYNTPNNKHWYDAALEFQKLSDIENKITQKNPEILENAEEKIEFSPDETLDMEFGIAALEELEQTQAEEAEDQPEKELFEIFDPKKLHYFIQQKKNEILSNFNNIKDKAIFWKIGDKVYYSTNIENIDKILSSDKLNEKYIKAQHVKKYLSNKFFYYLDAQYIKDNYENIECIINKTQNVTTVRDLACRNKNATGIKLNPTTFFFEIKTKGDDRIVPDKIYLNSHNQYLFVCDKIVNHKELNQGKYNPKIEQVTDFIPSLDNINRFSSDEFYDLFNNFKPLSGDIPSSDLV